MRSLFVLAVTWVICIVQADDCPQDTCSTSETCCASSFSGQYGCCPQPNAVCCPDGLHFCPSGTKCNMFAGSCDSSNDHIPFIFSQKPVVKFTATGLHVAEKVDRVYCQGGQYYCPNLNTCCRLPSGQYTCCPYPAASCCSDGYHCCPYGQRCDSTSTYCIKGNNKYAALFKKLAIKAV